jgi:hypothetical protein
MKKQTVTRLAAGAAMTLGLGLALAMPAQADHGGGGSASGDCSMGGTWELKASADNSGRHTRDDHGRRNRIEVEFKVRADNENRDLWNGMISDNGTVVKEGTGRANDELARRRNIANLDGPDTIMFSATNTMSGQTCEGQVIVRGGHH